MATFTKSLKSVRKQIEHMKENRFEQYVAAKEIHHHVSRGKNVLVSAEEKSGKRIIVEILALLDWKKYYKHNGPHPVNIYVTGLVRNDCKTQLSEMEKDYNVQAYALRGKKGAQNRLEQLDRLGTMRGNTKIHVDECDYASGGKQALSVFWKAIKARDGCNGILYSATSEECMLSKEMSEGIETVTFIPSSTYRGAEWYLGEGLVCQSERFWDSSEGTWTEHGQALVDGLVENSRSPDVVRSMKRVGVVRLSSNRSCKDYPTCFTALNGKEQDGINVMFVDEKNPFEWGVRRVWQQACSEVDFDRGVIKPKALLVVICETCTRSTELAGHDFIDFWHDNRSLDKCAYSTLSQALGRIKHYSDGSNRIQVYSDPRVFQLNCGEMSFSDVKRIAGRTKSRVVKRDQDTGVTDIRWADEETGGDALVWQTGVPTTEKCGFIVKAAKDTVGKWANYDGKFRCVGKCPALGGSAATERNHRALVYQSATSDEWTIRTYRAAAADREVRAAPTEQQVKYTHNTSISSMYERIDDTPVLDLSAIDIDIRGMGVGALKNAIRNNAKRVKGDLGGSKAVLQKTLHDMRRRS